MAAPSLLVVRLADALATRLNAVVPEPVHVSSRANEVRAWETDRNTFLGTLIWQPEDEGLDRWLETVCSAVLNGVQDFVAETTTEPWPGRDALPIPSVFVSEEHIELGLGPLELPPILRSELND